MRAYNTDTTGDGLLKDLSGEIKGKAILTTGVSPGTLGGFFVETIAKAQPATLILAGRNEERTQRTASAIQAAYPEIKVYTLQLNLSSLAAVREAAATVNSWQHTPAIDVVVNNAGLMATDFSLTVDGYETQFASNHLGHFLFTNLIMGKLLASKSPRVVNVSSDGHRLSPIRWADYNFRNGETYNRWRAYGQSKTANILMAISLAEKLGSKHGLTAFSLHPGVISTSLGAHLDFSVELGELAAVDKSLGNAEGWADLKWKSPERGVATHIYAAFEPSLKEQNGAYLEDSHVADPYTNTVKPWATSSIEADRLWKLSEKLVGQEFQY
ncbi:WW domain-containing oxidoreductase [Trichoderma gamsii]|uniref:WW domain-containing oxidoreductase n=1 Tax=Trichoderma gamsii TaxID=398673 RepID=A0A2P4ZX92_9HYPO|nr:WW domain-containing oxidoreductase [Trichoderma gamsii]PON28915.1 WW domain-containing oxidoreductase [Trichoderma gamsii]